MNLDKICGQNVMIQFDRPMCIGAYSPDQFTFVPVMQNGTNLMIDTLVGRLSKDDCGCWVLTYANPLDMSKSLIEMRFNSDNVVQACVVRLIQPSAEAAASPSVSPPSS